MILTHDEKKMLIWMDLQKKARDEIAMKLNIPRTAVKSHLDDIKSSEEYYEILDELHGNTNGTAKKFAKQHAIANDVAEPTVSDADQAEYQKIMEAVEKNESRYAALKKAMKLYGME